MSDLDQGSLRYYGVQACDRQWRDFLSALASELNSQMPADELRAFFFVVGKRIAEANPVQVGESLEQLETNLNQYFSSTQWGWVKIQDLHSSLEFLHSCSPLRAAFGDAAMEWCPALIEGIYSVWMKQLGAGDDLQLRQVGHVDGASDTLRLRLAHPSMFI